MAEEQGSRLGSVDLAALLFSRIHLGHRMFQGKTTTPRGFFTHVFGDVGPDEIELIVLQEDSEPLVAEPVIQVDPVQVVQIPEPISVSPPLVVPAPQPAPSFRPKFGGSRIEPTVVVPLEELPPVEPPEPEPVTITEVEPKPIVAVEPPQAIQLPEPARTLLDLMHLALNLETDAPLESGVSHLNLRALVKSMVPMHALLKKIVHGQLEEACTLLQESHRETAHRVSQVQQVLETGAQSLSVDEVVTGRAETILVRMMSGEVKQLPSTLRKMTEEARALLTVYEQQTTRWTQLRGELLATIDRMQIAVADLAFAHQHRRPVETATTTCAEIQETVHALLVQLEQIHQGSAQQCANMATLEMRVLDVNGQIESFVAQLESLSYAVESLEVPALSRVFTEAQSLRDRIRAHQDQLVTSTQPIVIIEPDNELKSFVDAVFPKWQQQVKQIISPIRPSEFLRPLERAEELKHLALVCMHIITQRKPQHPTEDGRHPGTSVAGYANTLVHANLIDESEAETVIEFIKNERKTGRTETVRAGMKNWKYRLKVNAEEEVQQIMRTLVDPDSIRNRIRKGNDDYYKSMRSRPESSEEQAS